MKKALLRGLAASILFLVAFAASAGDDPALLSGFKRENLEVYLSRADAEKDRDSWLKLAGLGESAVLADWERAAAHLYESGEDRERARAAVGAEIASMTQERYRSWLVRRFLEATDPQSGYDAVRRAVDEANYSLLYERESDGSGRVKRDSQLDPILKGSADLEGDTKAWKDLVGASLDSSVSAWQGRVDAASSELLREFGGGAELAAASEELARAAGARREGYRRELMALFSLEEGRFVSLRSYDSYSLKNKSNEAAALAVTDRLIRETKGSVDGAIGRIRDGLAAEAARPETSTDVETTEWLASFKLTFESGLAKWDSAEESFLAERVEWERNAGADYRSGEEAWATAYRRLQGERMAWEAAVRLELDKGRNQWGAKRAELAAAIDRAQKDFTTESAERKTAADARVSAIVDLYTQSASMVGTATSSGKYWTEKLTGCAGFDTASYKAWFSARLADYGKTLDGIKSSTQKDIASLETELSDARDDLEEVLANLDGSSDSITAPVKYYEPVIRNRPPKTRPRDGDDGGGDSGDTYSYQKPVYWDLGEYLVYRRDTANATIARLEKELAEKNARLARVLSLTPELAKIAADGGAIVVTDPVKSRIGEAVGVIFDGAGTSETELWNAYSEGSYWLVQKVDYTDTLGKALAALKACLGETLSDSGSLPTLQSVLGKNGDVEGLYLDEYQIELLRAEALKAFWEKRLAIAVAVKTYADQKTSDRPTEASQRDAYAAALEVYGEKKAAYDSLVKSLSSLGAKLGSSRESLDAAQKRLAAASSALAKAESDFSSLLALYDINDTTYFQNRIDAAFKSLADSTSVEPGKDGLYDAMLSYIEAGRRYGFQEEIRAGRRSLEELVNGRANLANPAASIPSVAALEKAVSDARAALRDNPRPSSASEAGLSLDDPYLLFLNALFTSMKDATGDERAYGEANVRLLLDKRLDSLVATLEERKSAIRLLSSPSEASWLDAEGVAAGAGGAEARLASASDAARLAELRARADLEKKMLERARFLGKTSGTDYDFSDSIDVGAWAILHRPSAAGSTVRMGDEEIDARSSLLGSLRNRIDDGASEAELAAWVKSQTNPANRRLLDEFLSGRGAATGASGLDLASLASVRGESDRLARLASVLDAHGAEAPGGIGLRRERAMAAAGKTLAALGVGKATAGGLELVSADSVAARIEKMSAIELVEWAVQVDAAMRRGAPGLGSSEAEELAAYYGRLLDYASLSASRHGNSYAEAEARAKAATAELAAAAKVAEDLSFALGETGSDKRLPAIASVLAWSDGAGSGVRLGEEERNSLEGTFRKNTAVLVARAMRDLVLSGKADSDATWELATGEALDAIAPGGLAPARKAGVLAEARRLRALDAELASGTATSAEGKRLLAYAAWRDFGDWLSSSAASLPVASADAASLSRVYGQFAATFPDGLSATDDEAKKTGLDAIAKFIEDTIPSSDKAHAKAFLDALAVEPPATTASLALSYLCPKLKVSDHDAFAAKSGGALYERALSLAIASSLSGPEASSVFDLIRSLSGLDSHGAVGAGDFGPAGSLDSLRARSLSGLDAASMGDEARAFDAMGRALAGQAVDPEALGLGSETKKLLADFLAVLDAKRGYVPSLSGSASDYAAANAAAAGISASELEAALSSDIWLSPFFLAPSSDPSAPGYLSLYSGRAEAELASAASLARNAASAKVAVLGEEANLARARFSFALSVNASAARLSADSYRAYASIAKTEDPTKPAPFVVTKNVKADSDTDRYQGADAGLNALIEAATELDRAGKFLLAACAAPDAAETDARQAAIDAFLASADSYFRGAAWNADDSADSEAARALAATAQGELDLASRKLSSQSSAAASAMANIVKFGSALAGFDKTARETKLAALRAAVERARSECLNAETVVSDASKAFATSINEYNDTYAASRRAYDELETARWDLALKDEVLEYAQNGYLRPDDTGDYRGPAAQLAYVQDKNVRAGVALDILKSLYSGSDQERRATEDRYAAYREKYRQYLEMRKFQGDLFSAIARQEQTVQSKEAAYRTELAKILKGTYASPFINPDTGSPLTERADESSGSPNWSNYLRADPSGYGLALNLVGNRLVKTSDEEWAAAKKDFEGTADSERSLSQAQLNAEKWSSDMAAYALRIGESAFRSRLDDWSRALTYLRLIASEAEDSATNPFGKLTGTGDSAGYLNGNAALYSVPTPNGPLNSMVNAAEASSRALAKAAYERITQSGNEAERKLWDYAVAMHLSQSAATDPFKFLGEASRLDTFQQVKNSLESSAGSCDRNARDCYILAAINTGIAAGFAAILCWPAVIMYGAEAALYAGMGLAAQIDANQYRTVISTNVNTLISTASILSAVSKTSLVGDLQSLSTARASLDKERAVLATLKGKSDSPITDSATVLASIDKAYSLLGKGSPSAEVKSLITSRMGMIGKVYTSADVVSRAVTLLADERSAEQGKADRQSADDAAALRLADEAYRKALAAYQAGTGSEADLRAKAAAAFKNPSYTFLSQQKLNIAFQLDGILASQVTDNESYEEERANSAQVVGEAIKALYAKRLEGEQSARAVEWADRQNELALREAEWNAKINASVKSGIAEWNDGTNRLQTSYEGWKAAYTTEYQSRTATWKAAYLDFQERKKTWTEKVAEKAGQASTAATFGDIAASADYEARVTNTELLAGLSLAKPDPDAELDRALNRATLARILEASAKSNERIGDIAYSFRSGIKASAASLSARDAARQLVAERSGEMAKHAAKIVARQARDNVAAAKASYEKSIEDANDSFVDGLSDQFGLQAYTGLGGGGWTREAIIGSTLISGVITERQNLAAYERYRTQITTKTSLDEGTLAAYDASGVEMLVEKAMKELDGERVRVFGDGTEVKNTDITVYDSTYTDPDAAADEKNFLEKAWDKVVETFSAKDTSGNRTVNITLGSGEFTAHIGYAPVLKQIVNPDESYSSNVLVAGSGQLGRIMGYFEYYQARQGKGYSEVKKPMYDKRIWNDEGSFVKSPTIKSTVNMGVSIAAMAIGNPWIAMAVNLADDAVFTAMDVSGGYKSGDQALFDFGKQVATSVVTTGLGQLGGKIMGSMGGVADSLGNVGKASGLYTIKGFEGVVARTLFTGAQAATTNLAASAIGGITYSTNNGWGYDENAFLEGALGKNATASVLGGMTSSLVSGSMGQWNLTDTNSNWLNSQTFKAADIRNLNGLAGGLASTAVSYGLTGEATLNIANMSMFGGPSAGLMEMHLGGADGFSLNLGSGGTDVSLGTLSSAFSGMRESAFVDSMKNGTLEQQRTFDAVNGLGYANGRSDLWTAGREVLEGKRRIAYSDTGKDYGSYDSTNPGVITLSNAFLSMDGSLGSAELAAAMAHEITHQNGNGVEGLAHIAGADVFGCLKSAWGVQDAGFEDQIISALNDENSWKENTGTVDYWKKMLDGTIVKDEHIWLTEEYLDPDGKLQTRKVAGSENETSMAAALVHYLGEDRARQLLDRETGGMLFYLRGDQSKNISSYDDKTLHDVLGLTDTQIADVRKNPAEWSRLFAGATQLERDKLLGEALMKHVGITWDDRTGWSGEGGFSMTDLSLPDGAINTVRLADGTYQNTFVSVVVVRGEKGFHIYDDSVPNTPAAQKAYLNDEEMLAGNKNNSTATFIQSDLQGNVLALYNPQSEIAGLALNTVDNLRDQPKNWDGSDNRYCDIGTMMSGWGTQQGSTIMTDFLMRMVSLPNDHVEDWGLAKGSMVFKFASGTMLDGKHIGPNGTAPGEKATYWHSSGRGNSDSCFIYYPSDYRADTAGMDYGLIMNHFINRWNLQPGVTVIGRLITAKPWFH